MTKSKKGAEPKGRTRERHVINEVNQFYHEGINQDNYRICRNRGFHRTSAYGYFFLGGEDSIKRVENKQTIIDNWDSCTLNDYGYKSLGLKKMCYAIYDKKRNILVLDEQTCPESWNIIKAVNKDCQIYKVRNITDANITRKPKQLALNYIDYLIDTIIINFSDVYRIIENKQLTVHIRRIYNKDIVKRINEIRAISNDFKSIPKNKSLGKTSIYWGPGAYDFKDIPFPTINELINYKVFNKEQIRLFNQKKWWTKYGYGKGISFKEVQAKWNCKVADLSNNKTVLWQDDEVRKQTENLKAWRERVDKLEAEVSANRKAAIDKILNLSKDEQLKLWRDDDTFRAYAEQYIYYKDFRTKGRTIEWFEHKEFVSLNCFENKQLKLSKDGKEVITSSNAVVTLVHAITLFNTIYHKYIIPHLVDWVKTIAKEDYIVDFIDKHIHIGYYELRRIGFKDKVTDYANVRLGYKEWFVEIGCHTLWLDDVKEFCRYYHLEDKVDFDCSEIKR